MTEMIWFPGGDGVFLHIGAAASLLDFTVIPAIHEIAVVLDWQLTVQLSVPLEIGGGSSG
ncbi:hypothetical protein AB0N89_20065 [Amycolatopsis sp. NPDC089917]|uniref:hypothetical protein n=1 Tax=Amycolatopsis sp. NPDC089917 TaxID=3155187 RepID=UPI003426CA15